MNVLWVVVPAGLATALWKLRGRGYKIDEQGRYVILDFERPRLPLVNTAFNFIGGLFPQKRFEIDDLIKKAHKRSGGLTDLGDEKRFPFRDGLEILLRDANYSGTLTPLGRFALHERIVQVLVDRLRMEDLVKQHPEILDEEISAPVFVVGLARSGTTHMHRCLAQLEELRPLKTYEIQFPVVTPEVREGIERGVDPRKKETQKILGFLADGRPLIKLFHEFGVEIPEEHYQLCDGVFRSFTPVLLFNCHGYMKWYSETDPTVQFDYLRRWLQIIQWQDAQLGKPRKPFLLKCADDIFRVPHLKKEFPDCKIVHTHRDTVFSMLSAMHLLSYMESNTSRVSTDEVVKGFMMYYESLKKVDWRTCGKDVCHVNFKDFVKDNVKNLKEVANALNLDISDKSWDNVSKYVKENTQHKHGRIHYDAKTFGLTEEELEERFAFYSIHGSSLVTKQ